MLNESKLIAAAKSFRRLFIEALLADTSFEARMLSLVSMEVPSTGDTESYNWVGAVPGMKEWVGERTVKDLEEFEFEIKNKFWESTIGVKRETIDDDKLGMVRPRIQDLAGEWIRNRWDLILALMVGGKTAACYDGKYFLATNHPNYNTAGEVSAENQANLTTDLLDKDAYFAARKRMQNLVRDNGRKFNLRPTHLLVCPALEQTGLEIVKLREAGGADNVWAGSVEVVVVAGLDGGGMTADKAWGLIDASRAIRGFVDQIREPVAFRSMDGATDEAVFSRRVFRYGVDYRGNAGTALWQCIQMSDGSGS